MQWSPDGSQVAFVSTSRNHQQANLRVADAATGVIRDVLEEKGETFLESGNGRVNWRYLPGSNEVIWFSQRDNWGHLYLHDLQTGKLKHADHQRRRQRHAAAARRRSQPACVYFQGVGKESGRDPYFRHFYRAGMDGKPAQLLTPEDADHDISLSPSGKLLRRQLLEARRAAHVGAARRRPARSCCRSRRWTSAGCSRPDGSRRCRSRSRIAAASTDLYGLLYRPTNFDPSKKYPIINHIYPGPADRQRRQPPVLARRAATRRRSPSSASSSSQIDGMGTPWRSKRFHDAYYGNMGDNTLPDQVAGMKELASRYPWIDIDRAGIYGHSGGGFATAAAMFRYPDFFKVGVSQAGNHDNRVYEDDWAEKWQGLLEKNADGTTNYDNQANQLVAHQLKGKLLLAHGSMDTNVPFYSTLLVVDALIKANKDFDLIIFPNRGHGFGNEPYMVRRRWDYFVRHLLGVEPPPYELKGAPTPTTATQ